jgi:thermostable 8-oxoguanine DNA glycosylase
MPDPDTEVISGVKWGRPEWVPSAAYWAAMSDMSREEDDYVCAGATLKEQVGFCLLGGFGITAEMNYAIYNRLETENVFAPGRKPSIDELGALLHEPALVEGKSRRYRFPNQRAMRLAEALRVVEESPPSHDDPLQFRRELMTIPGIGPKTASWITRNWLGSDDVAILDIHIIRAGMLIGLFKVHQKVERDYEAMEVRFLAFARALDVRPSLLDAVMWRSMRKLGRTSV